MFVLYKVNTAYSRAGRRRWPRAGLDGRFDVQVNQALPFGVARHQVGSAASACGTCSAIRTIRRRVYDELLVVRPPKRVVGGFLVRF